MERVHFITHRGKRVLLIDHSRSTAGELRETIDEVERIVAAEPPDSLLILGDFTATEFDKAAADRLKVVATKDRPHVRRAAFVGAEAIPEVYYQNLQSFSARRFPRFKTREEALDWLISDDCTAAAS